MNSCLSDHRTAISWTSLRQGGELACQFLHSIKKSECCHRQLSPYEGDITCWKRQVWDASELSIESHGTIDASVCTHTHSPFTCYIVLFHAWLLGLLLFLVQTILLEYHVHNLPVLTDVEAYTETISTFTCVALFRVALSYRWIHLHALKLTSRCQSHKIR